MQEYEIYVGGQFKKTEKPLEIVGPYSRKVEFTTYLATEKEFEEATVAAEKVEKEMAEMPIYQRFEILKQVSDELAKNRIHLAQVMAREAGKPMKYALGEVERAVLTFLTAAEESKRLPGEVMSIDWVPAGKGKEAIIKYFPVGLVAAIAPFNFPLNLVAHKVAPAIAAGCPIVLKPASQTPIIALELAKIIDKTSLPKGAFSVIPMDRQTGNALVTDDRYKLLTFTGSPWVGWNMKKDCGKKKVVLELGGNAGLIITKNSEIDKVVPKAVAGGFAYAGQSCIHTQRILVEDEIFDEFLTKFKTQVESFRYGDPLDEKADITSMIDEKNAIRIEEWVNEAVEGGATLVCGGKRDGTYYEATVLTDTNPEMKVCFDEVFAPVVVIEKFSNFEKAIEEVNNSEFGLQAGIFTNDYRQINYAWKNLDVGGVVINDVPTFRMDQMPYGGVKDSGIGREGPKYAIHDMMEPRILILDNN